MNLHEAIARIQKGHPVGHINKYGKQKQSDGSWKHVGKGKGSKGEKSSKAKEPSFIDMLNNPEARGHIDAIEEYINDLRDQPGRKEFIDGAQGVAAILKKKFNYTYDLKEHLGHVEKKRKKK